MAEMMNIEEAKKKKLTAFQKLFRIYTLLLGGAVAVFGYAAWTIWSFSGESSSGPADAAIILGAGVGPEGEPGDIFKARIAHAVSLYKKGAVKKLVFTGGWSGGSKLTEAASGADEAVKNGVPKRDILMEALSSTTYDNLKNAREAVRGTGLKTFLIVSDPLHMKRALTMACDLGLDAKPSPTQDSKITGFRNKGGFLLRESFYYLLYLAERPFM